MLGNSMNLFEVITKIRPEIVGLKSGDETKSTIAESHRRDILLKYFHSSLVNKRTILLPGHYNSIWRIVNADDFAICGDSCKSPNSPSAATSNVKRVYITCDVNKA